jgi:hypothetical protein
LHGVIQAHLSAFCRESCIRSITEFFPCARQAPIHLRLDECDWSRFNEQEEGVGYTGESSGVLGVAVARMRAGEPQQGFGQAASIAPLQAQPGVFS